MIEIKDLYFGYRTAWDVFGGISLKLEPGHIHGLLGLNGVGRTTLVKLMAGLLTPKKGRISVGGFNPAQRTPSFYSRMCFIPEDFDLPGVPFNAFVRNNSVFYPNFSQEMLDMYVAVLDVDTEASLDGISLSDQKKAYIAFAMACQADYLFIDELNSELDAPTQTLLKSLLVSTLTPERTLVLSTHEAADLQRIVDNVVIMDRDGIVLNETTERLGQVFKFGPVTSADKVIWLTDTQLGRMGVCEGVEGNETAVDLEAFFRAVQVKPEKITQILNR